MVLRITGECLECELVFRQQEWASWTNEQRDSKPGYCTMEIIKGDKNFTNKGNPWNTPTKYIVEAKRELNLTGEQPGTPLTQTVKRRAIFERATELAKAYGPKRTSTTGKPRTKLIACAKLA